jgi:hypothetical protein
MLECRRRLRRRFWLSNRSVIGLRKASYNRIATDQFIVPSKRNIMTMRSSLLLSAVLVFTGIMPGRLSAAGELMVGCCTRPACGKVCQLVCGTKKLTATCYGSECKDICVPGRSRQGCKHCVTTCGSCEGEGTDCAESGCRCCPSCQPMPPKCEFCWYDWFACGCARPRTVKVLTKYQAEKEIPWYHWEVVDVECCETIESTPVTTNASSRPATPPRFFKPAPAESQIGDSIDLSEAEQGQLASWMAGQLDQAIPVESIDAPSEQKEDSTPIAKKFSNLFRLGD